MADDKITCLEIIEEWLKNHGYDGLIQIEGDMCGCVVGDLAPCGEFFNLDCVPGYKGPDPSGDAPWLIYATKEAARKAEQEINNG